MATALGILGIPTWQSLLWFSSNHGEIDMWIEALDAKFSSNGRSVKRQHRSSSKRSLIAYSRYTRREWDQLLYKYGAVSADTPACSFSEDLIEAYPEARVILTIRDIDSWYQSFDKAVISPITRFSNLVATKISRGYLAPMYTAHSKAYAALGLKIDRDYMRANARQTYIEFYDHIRRITPPDRLLEFRLEDGWEPLCNFVGKEVPDQPFPHVNDSVAMQEKLSIIIGRGVKQALWKIFIWLVPILVVLRAMSVVDWS